MRTNKTDKELITKKYSIQDSTNISPQIAQEAPAVYAFGTHYPGLTDRLRLLRNIESSTDSRILINNLLKKTHLTLAFLAEQVFEITPKTLAQYKNNQVVLPARLTEIGTELVQLYELGIALFGNYTQFNKWMNTACYGPGS